MLYDTAFLEKLNEQVIHSSYVKLTALDLNENPIDQLEGQVTSGSINLDGKSAIRRSCSLSFIAPISRLNDYYWTFKQKIKVEIGIENHVDTHYPDIIWFPMGMFFITSFSASMGTNNCSISIQAKDKMCLLNGELGGVINAETDFGSEDYTDIYGNITNTKLEIKDIIENLIYTYAQEPLANIIIQDLDTIGLEQLDYKYDIPMYLIRKNTDKIYLLPMFENTEVQVYPLINGQLSDEAIPLMKNENIIYDSLMATSFNQQQDPTEFAFEYSPTAQLYCAAKLEYGEAVGYRICPLVYNTDLIAKAGDTVTSVLDKLVKMLGEFEYFYDLYGRFVFRRKKSYINTVWTPQVTTADGDTYVEPYMTSTPYIYEFKNNQLLTNISNSPKLDSIKNDYTVWGERTSSAGGKIPIHSRYAIDKKPFIYVSVAPLEDTDNKLQIWCTATFGSAESIVQYRPMKWLQAYCIQHPDGYVVHDRMDWRELIYQMAKEYRRYNRDTTSKFDALDYWDTLRIRNAPYCNSGHTGYEPYYTDLEGFWRQLYYPFDINSEEDLEKVSVFKQVDDDVEVNKLKDVYMTNCYRPNSTLIKTYPKTAKKEIQLKPNEEIIDIPNTNRCAVLNNNTYYYKDMKHHGFVLPQNNDEYQTFQEFVKNPEQLQDYKYIYTLAEPLENQSIYTIAKVQFGNTTDMPFMVPILDTYNYLPTANNPTIIGNTSISQFYTPNYDDVLSTDTYIAINESYKGSKYNLYYLPNNEDTIMNTVRDLRIIRSLIEQLLTQNSTLFNSWTAYQKYLHEGYTQANTLLDWLDAATNYDLNLRTYPMTNESTLVPLFRCHIYFKKMREYYGENVNSSSFLILFLKKLLSIEAPPATLDAMMIDGYNLFDINADGNIAGDDFLLLLRYFYGISSLHQPSITIGLETTDDALTVLRQALGILQCNPNIDLTAMDYNNDGIIDTVDALLILRAALDIGNNESNSEITNGDLQSLYSLVYNFLSLSYISYFYCQQAIGQTTDNYLTFNNTNLPLDFYYRYLSPRETIASYNYLFDLFESNSAAMQLSRLLCMYYHLIYENWEQLRALGTPHYQSFTSLINMVYMPYTQSDDRVSIYNLWSKLYIKDTTNYYSLADITANTALQEFYQLPTTIKNINELPTTYLNAQFNLYGQPSSQIYDVPINYYMRDFLYYLDSATSDKRLWWWNKSVYTEPYKLNFWFDFLESVDSEIGAYAVSEIGDRPIVVNETNLKSIFYREIPKIIIMDSASFSNLKPNEIKTGYSYILFPPGYENFFSISARGISIKNRIDELLYQHTYCQQNINLTAIPIYHLDVNSRIKIIDELTHLNMDCAIQTISYSLNYNGTMSLNTVKIQPNSNFEREE